MTKMSHLQDLAEQRLRSADIDINGRRPWDINVRDQRLYARAIRHGSLGLGEAYEEDWWDCERLDIFFEKLLAAHVSPGMLATLSSAWLSISSACANLQTIRRSKVVGEKHYDLGNDLYRAMLDSRMMYSCAYFGRGAKDLDEAQIHKLELICEKLQLSPGQRVLDIGCGWGGLAEYMARHFGVRVVGVTISKEQAHLAREKCAGLPADIRLCDYRELVTEQFDRIVSVGMFEHVGEKNYPAYMETVSRCLKDDGLFLLHTIGGSGKADPWIHKYIFPGGVLPRREQLEQALQGHFHLWDWHAFGQDYDRTLILWHKNFEAAWDNLKSRYDERFRRRWRYYLLMCAGTFRARRVDLWQILLSKKAADGYLPVR